MTAAALVPCLPVLIAGRTLAWRDSASLFGPMRPLISDALRQFSLPLWNPYEGAGMPLFAQMMHGVLHPWSLLAAMVESNHGVDVMIVLNVLTGTLGASVLARTVGANSAGSAVAGLAYGLSGYVLGLTANVQYLTAAGSAPWAIAAVRSAGSGRVAAILLAAIATAVSTFAGDPQWTVVAAMLGMLLAIERDGMRGGWLAASAVAMGAALAAVQLLPGWTMFSETSRSVELTSGDVTQWAFNPARMIEFVVPGFFAGRPGATPAPVFLFFERESQYPLPFLPSVHIGLPVLMCALFGVRATRTARCCGVAAGILLWVSLGHRLFATQALSWVPVWGSFRYAEKLVGPFTLLIAVIAGIGLPSFAARGLELVRLIARAAVPTAIGCAVVLFMAAYWSSGPVSWPPEIWPLLCSRLAGGFFISGGMLAGMGVAGAPWRAPCSAIRERWVVALVLTSGLLAAPAALHAGRPDARDPEPLAELRDTSVVPRVIQPVDQISLPISRGFDMFDAAQVVRSATARASYNVPARIDAFITYTGLLPGRYGELLKRLDALGPERWTAYRRFAVTHAVLTPPLTDVDVLQANAAVAGGTQVRFDALNTIQVFEVPHTPWARFAGRVRPSSPEDAIGLTAEALAGVRETVILEGAAPAGLAEGSVLSIERYADRLRVVAEARGHGLLIVADAWWPGWIAEIDGRSVPVQRADAILRAVPWPPGRHVLEMRYRPREVYFGAVISATMTIILAAMALVGYRLKRISGGIPPPGQRKR